MSEITWYRVWVSITWGFYGGLIAQLCNRKEWAVETFLIFGSAIFLICTILKVGKSKKGG